MKLVTTVRLTGALLAGVLLSLFSANSFALTVAGATISNLATVNYTVGTTPQTSIGSSVGGNTSGAGPPTTFLVDNKLVLVVAHADGADVAVSPGATQQVLSFTVTNNGNFAQGVSFSTVQEGNGTNANLPVTNPFTGTDNFDPTAIQVFVHANGTAYGVGAFNAGTDTQSAIGQIAPGQTISVYIVSSIPATQVDGDVAVEGLVATVDTAGGAATYGTAPGATSIDQSGSAWTSGTVQTIWADAAAPSGSGNDGDAAKDGKSSDREAYLVKSAKLTITKGTPTVLADPTLDATPHAIPGAVMQYTVTIANSGTATSNATSITLTDGLPANTSWGGSTGVSGTTGVGTLKVTTPGVNTGTQFACPDGSVHTQAATGGAPYVTVSCDFGQTTASTITVSALALKPGDTTTIVYTVTIN